MIAEALLAGMLMAVGAFAVKAGIGLHYLLSRVRGGTRARAGVLAAFGLAYLGLFGLCGWIAGRWDWARPGGAVQGLLESGMILHVAASAGLALWGVRLLRRPDHAVGSTKGWAAMVVPCPVCMVVLVLSMAAARTFIPGCGLEGHAYGLRGVRGNRPSHHGLVSIGPPDRRGPPGADARVGHAPDGGLFFYIDPVPAAGPGGGRGLRRGRKPGLGRGPARPCDLRGVRGGGALLRCGIPPRQGSRQEG